MPNASTHRFGAALATGLIALTAAPSDRPSLARPLAAATGGYALGTLPDILEPALNPNHRSHFHSAACLAAVVIGTYRAYQWEPEEVWQQWLRRGLIVGGIAYASHLLMDSTTPKGLPIV